MLVVYDITVRQSWENVQRWVEEARRMLPEHEPMVPFILGTYALAHHRRVHSSGVESPTRRISLSCSRGQERPDRTEAGVC
jgi:hypothetical protein